MAEGLAAELTNLVIRDLYPKSFILKGYQEFGRLINRVFHNTKYMLGVFDVPQMDQRWIGVSKEEKEEHKRHLEIATVVGNIQMLVRADIRRFIENYPDVFQEHGYHAAGKNLVLIYIFFVDPDRIDITDRFLSSLAILTEFYFYYLDEGWKLNMQPEHIWIDYFATHCFAQIFEHCDLVKVHKEAMKRYYDTYEHVRQTEKYLCGENSRLYFWDRIFDQFEKLSHHKKIYPEELAPQDLAVKIKIQAFFDEFDPLKRLYRPYVPDVDFEEEAMGAAAAYISSDEESPETEEENIMEVEHPGVMKWQKQIKRRYARRRD